MICMHTLRWRKVNAANWQTWRMNSSDLPKDRGKLKYIAFFHVAMRTKEGPAHVFMALDVERDYLINLGVEPEVTDDVVLKHIYLLTEHPEFEPHCKIGF